MEATLRQLCTRNQSGSQESALTLARIEVPEMHSPRSVTSRASLAIFFFTMTALTLGLWPRAVVNAHSGSALHPATTSGCIGNAKGCWLTETVDFNPSDYNYVTGIENGNHIVGGYSSDDSLFQSFFVKPNPEPTAYPSPFTSENDPSYASTFLQGLSNDGFQVGYAGSGCASCTTVGVLYYNGNWTTIQDPNGGGCPAITQVLAINDTEQGVGWYEKSINGTCSPQAFEFYPRDSSNFVYHDLSPQPLTGTYLSSKASGINTLGDVVGTVTYGSLAHPHTAGWVYSELNYYTFANGSDNTDARDINYNDGVVGDYSDSAGTHGFFVANPENTPSPSFDTLDVSPHSPPYTIVNSINTSWLIAGWYEGGGQAGRYHGFVGLCVSQCPNSQGATKTHNPARGNQVHSRFSPRLNGHK
jgi:hypothetical protein